MIPSELQINLLLCKLFESFTCYPDESPSTCSEFLQFDGLKLFKRMLLERPTSEPILTKILGLLNNIAEVPDLRSSLMDDDIIASIRYPEKILKVSEERET